MPADARFSLHFVAVSQHFHPVVVETVGFSQVDDVELDFEAFPCVSDFKEEPLGMTVGVDVVL